MSLPHDIQYCVDSEVELLGFTGDIGHYVRTYMKDWHWVDSLHNIHSTFKVEAQTRYKEWLKNAPNSQKNACIVEGIRTWEVHFNDLIKEVTHEAISSLYKKLKNDRGKKELHSKRHIMKTLRKSESFNKILKLYVNLGQMTVIDQTIIDSGKAEISRAYRESTFYIQRAMSHNRANAVGRNCASKREMKKIRKRNVKATNMLSKLAGKETARIYISGQEVKITGQNVEIRVTKGDFNRTDWATNNISFYDLDGNHLTDSCVYFHNTPAPEQIAAMVLTVQSGEEESLLTGGNLYNISEAGYDHPILSKVLKNKRHKIMRNVRDHIESDANFINDITDAEERLNELHRRAMQTNIDLLLHKGEFGKTRVINKFSTPEFCSLVEDIVSKHPLVKKLNRLYKKAGGRSALLIDNVNANDVALAMSNVPLQIENTPVNYINQFNVAETIFNEAQEVRV